MAPENNEKIIQRLGVVFETDEQSKETVLRSLDEINEKASKIKSNFGDSGEGASKLADVLKKDLGGALDKLSPALGELSSVFKAAGPISAGVAGMILLRDRMADLEGVAVGVNRQFSNLHATITDIAAIQKDLQLMGLNKEQANGLVNRVATLGPFSTEDQIKQATVTSAAAGKMTGMDPGEIANIIAIAVRTGALDVNDISGGMFGANGKRGMFQGMIEGQAEASMSMQQYTKSLFELWNVTRNYNVSFENTQKLLVNWSDELNKGIVSLKDVADLATGQRMSDSQKLFMAQRLQTAHPDLGLTGSPLEVLTKFEAGLNDPAFQQKMGKIIYDMASERSKNPEEMVQWVRMLNDSLTGGSLPGLDSIRGASTFLEKYATTPEEKFRIRQAFPKVEEPMTSQIESDVAKAIQLQAAKSRASSIGSVEQVKEQLQLETLMSTSTVKVAGMLVDQAFSAITSNLDQGTKMREAFRAAERGTVPIPGQVGGMTEAAIRAQKALQSLPQEAREDLMRKWSGQGQQKPIEIKNNIHNVLDINLNSNGQPIGKKTIVNNKPGQQKFALPDPVLPDGTRIKFEGD